MTAKEMFEKLGFKQEIIKRQYYDVCNYKNGDITISFDIKDKEYDAYQWDDDDYGFNSYVINLEVHKAITQQMKELGWLDD